MNETIVLVGGPQDGREITTPAGSLLPAIRFPRLEWRSLEETGPTSLLLVDEYALGTLRGHPSRDDTGRIRYLYVRTDR